MCTCICTKYDKHLHTATRKAQRKEILKMSKETNGIQPSLTKDDKAILTSTDSIWLFHSGTAWQTQIKLENITIHPISIILQGMMVRYHSGCIACIQSRYSSRNNDHLCQITSNFLLFCTGAIRVSIASDAERIARLFS